jgi:3-deoxy-D-manno-octulosonic-acid transferase
MKSISERAFYNAYRLAGQGTTPFLRAQMHKQAKQGLVDPDRLPERFGYASQARPEGPVIWFHAATVDELRSVFGLVQLVTMQGVSAVITTPSLSAMDRGQAELPTGAILQYAPVDVARCVNRFLDHWQPELFVIAGGDIWPVTVECATSRKVPTIIVSGRLSAASTASWQKRPSFARPTFSAIDFIGARTERDADTFRELGASAVQVTGDLSYDIPASLGANASRQADREPVPVNGDRNAWLAFALSAEELDLTIAAQKALIGQGHDCRCLIVPSKKIGREVVEAKLDIAGLPYGVMGSDEIVDQKPVFVVVPDAKLIDQAWQSCKTVYLGASFGGEALGGLSPVDAIAKRRSIVCGRIVHRHAEIYARLYQARAAHFINDVESLAGFVGQSLRDEVNSRRMQDNALAVLDELKGTLNITYKALDSHIRPLCYRARIDSVLARMPDMPEEIAATAP